MKDLTYDIWEVTTEADCEGRSTKSLGVFEGHIDDIAFHLADKVYSSLKFSKVDIKQINIPIPKADRVTISLENPTSFEKYTEIFKDQNVFLKKGFIFDGVTLFLNNPVKEKEVQAKKALDLLRKNGYDINDIKQYF